MNFLGLQAKYSRIMHESAAWKLLRADNVHLILAFMDVLFSEEREVSFSQAKVLLDSILIQSNEEGVWETEVNGHTYLNQWINEGWLRELDDYLSRTDACEIAQRFSQGLEERTTGTTSSHLRIVQDAVRDFTVAISPDIEARTQILEQKRDEIQREIDDLNNGVVSELSEKEQKERIKEIYQLASVLTGDFRLIEDEIRQLDQKLRIEIIEDGSSKGALLKSVLEHESLLIQTDAGSAFDGFFQLLSDPNRSIELRQQLKAILSHQAAENLSAAQKQYLSKLMRELSRESNRVFDIRRKTEESLRHYLESGSSQENRAVDKLISQLEQSAVQLKDLDCNLKMPTTLFLPVGAITIRSPESIRLKTPDEKFDTTGVEEAENSRELSEEMLSSLDSVQIKDIAQKTKQILIENGPMSIAKLSQEVPLNSGVEELVAYVRIAQAVNATSLNGKESLQISDKFGNKLIATIPVYLLSAELFPNSIDDLVL